MSSPDLTRKSVLLHTQNLLRSGVRYVVKSESKQKMSIPLSDAETTPLQIPAHVIQNHDLKNPISQSTNSDADALANCQTLEDIQTVMGDCKRCGLCADRKKLVFGIGNPHARLMFVGEGPGADEDVQGEPFVGRAGQLLTKMIQAMKLERSDVYIANIVKCRPPNNRAPEQNEMETCTPFLVRQVELVKPEVIVCLGKTAVQGLLNSQIPITKLRGKWQEWRGVPVMPTFHPAFLLRSPDMKKFAWEDLQSVMKTLGM